MLLLVFHGNIIGGGSFVQVGIVHAIGRVVELWLGRKVFWVITIHFLGFLFECA